MFCCFKRNKHKYSASNEENPDTLPKKIIETQHNHMLIEEEEAAVAVNPRQFWNTETSLNDWMAEMYKEELIKGTFDNLSGKGKPINVPTGDITNSILKNANYLPDWLVLQHEIRDQIHNLILLTSNNTASSSLIMCTYGYPS